MSHRLRASDAFLEPLLSETYEANTILLSIGITDVAGATRAAPNTLVN